jgi:hypothetical protein
MAPLDYEPPRTPKPDCLWIGVGIGAFVIYGIMWAMLFVVGLTYMDAPQNSVPHVLYLINDVVSFPLFYIFPSKNLGAISTITFTILNACIWSFSAGGLCYIIRRRYE